MVCRGQENFPKTARLRKRPEFLTLSRTGRKTQTGSFVIISKANAVDQARLGITVSSKVGNAVVRNRIKRLVREFFRRDGRELATGLDVLVIARSTAKDISFADVAGELAKGWPTEGVARGRERNRS
jgi:ribonuclease P protein component